jgi:hypothetical protein
MVDQKIQASNFVGALDQIEYVKQHFRALATSWSKRLASLQKARVQLSGQRPTDKEEESPAMESETE